MYMADRLSDSISVLVWRSCLVRSSVHLHLTVLDLMPLDVFRSKKQFDKGHTRLCSELASLRLAFASELCAFRTELDD